jgi:hypothetical protein
VLQLLVRVEVGVERLTAPGEGGFGLPSPPEGAHPPALRPARFLFADGVLGDGGPHVSPPVSVRLTNLRRPLVARLAAAHAPDLVPKTLDLLPPLVFQEAQRHRLAA